ncbi:single-stranded DNA-binding protein [Agromyces sp. H3Y2-19a]|uniref:single-stranded DNA-binding protein n=1 Tax=Agromyces chromiiresistens TaxID=3030835 RepID=UPI0023B969EA|nr:single-stranded DNA-binding protein [Agromyces chromiiresistens]MDF0515131.1 single-stranded DNA-binding protein [Agromyces chromiiresistens]
MTDSITVTGIVGTDPIQKVTGDGLVITTFRLASTRRYFDRAKGTWENAETNWFSVSAFRQLARNASLSVRKGQHVIVQGRLRVRAWETGTKSGKSVEIDADSIGHDMAWCVSTYARMQSEAKPAEHDPIGEAASPDGLGEQGERADLSGLGGGTDWSGLASGGSTGFDDGAPFADGDAVVGDDLDDDLDDELEADDAGRAVYTAAVSD